MNKIVVIPASWCYSPEECVGYASCGQTLTSQSSEAWDLYSSAFFFLKCVWSFRHMTPTTYYQDSCVRMLPQALQNLATDFLKLSEQQKAASVNL